MLLPIYLLGKDIQWAYDVVPWILFFCGLCILFLCGLGFSYIIVPFVVRLRHYKFAEGPFFAFISWMLLPIYLTTGDGELLDNPYLQWSNDGSPWFLLVCYLVFLCITVPFFNRKMTYRFKEEFFSFIHAIFLTIILTFTHMILDVDRFNELHFLPKLLIIWMIGLLLWVLQKSKRKLNDEVSMEYSTRINDSLALKNRLDSLLKNRGIKNSKKPPLFSILRQRPIIHKKTK